MNKKTVLVIGSGGREHALGWKLAQSSKVGKIYFAPGNAGTSLVGENVAIDALDIKGLLEFALTNKIDLTVVGPDDVLAAGAVDAFQKKGLTIFGPTQKAAQIESSKVFSKQLMLEEGIPTAKFAQFTDVRSAKKYLNDWFSTNSNSKVVIKASGLALGKGVIIVSNVQEAEKALEEFMVKKVFGEAGSEVVIEEFLEGHEVSIHVFSDGEHISVFPTSRDHKTIYDDNRGPNTGGMGTIAPLPYLTEKDLDYIKEKIVMPVIRGMKERAVPFVGLLYPGLMMTKDGPKVLEFNARFGDPETQSYMRLLETDLFDIFMACIEGKLGSLKISWSKQSACCIVLASAGYPGSYKKGEVIHGLDHVSSDSIIIFHAGTKQADGEIVTNGGRVLGVTAIGKTLDGALKKAYGAIGERGIRFAGMQFRKDIGK
jgi:phosphoribosylamine---glycine ligase